ncbi:hypothetical protein [Scytonema sp. PRP1]|uniref:hypothetical protein n=1 Tax=Scytonema sp. PRP1 TaxID=3120513 RepID=UPI00300C5927
MMRQYVVRQVSTSTLAIARSARIIAMARSARRRRSRYASSNLASLTIIKICVYRNGAGVAPADVRLMKHRIAFSFQPHC